MDTNFYLIRCADDLLYLKSLRSLFYRFNAVKLDIENLEREISIRWEQKINRYYKACGCGEGKFFVFVFFLFAIAWKHSKKELLLSWRTFSFVFLMCLLGAFLGKAYGQYFAFRKLKRIINDLESSNWQFY